MYRPLRPAGTLDVPIRHGRYRLHVWEAAEADDEPAPPAPSGEQEQPLLLLLHGWMDVGASYQFMVDALPEAFMQGRRIVAPDWRGFGHSALPAADHVVFADYLADLDALIDTLSPHRPVDLVGHSMGGNVAMLYAGVRPERVRRLVNLEGFGLPASTADQAPGRYAQWLDEIRDLHQGSLALRGYADAGAVARRLVRTNPRLDPAKADWLAQQWAEPRADGQWHLLAQAAHKVVSAQLYRADEVAAVWRAIRAPVLVVEASDNAMAGLWQGRYTRDDFHARLQAVAHARIERLGPAGHNVHHDQPEALAALMYGFLAG
ncbi:alpha/beta hydrolase [Comamonadaceae bacterium PP-2]